MTKKALIGLDDIERICNGLKLELLSRDISPDLVLKIGLAIDTVSKVYKKWFDDQSQAPQWVSVEDDLPPKDEFVAVKFKHGEYWLRAEYTMDHWFDDTEEILIGVTHWMRISGWTEKRK